MSEATTERWSSRLGLVLAVAGNAIGLGNFLRFPRLAAEYGGGAFLVPYFIALLVLGIPLMWVEWSMGRYGGIYGHHSTPGMYGRITKSRWGLAVGSLGVSLPLLFAIYYTYIESWTLAYSAFSATGQYFENDSGKISKHMPPEIQGVTFRQLTHLLDASDVKFKQSDPSTNVPGISQLEWTGTAADFERLDTNGDKVLSRSELQLLLSPLAKIHTAKFLRDYQGVTPENERVYFKTLSAAIIFWIVTIAINVYILSRGISGGIEILAKIAMPLLFLFAFILVVAVFIFGTPDPNIPTRNVWAGLDFVWKPRFESLFDPKVWVAAAGQIFFTLSIGTGSIQAYSSYLKRNDDCALAGLATATTNEFAEVVLGGTIAIPIAVASFGIVATQAIAASASFDLGFIAMPMIFQHMPLGQLFGTLWFLLLFFAGVTSSVALCQPVIGFMSEAYGWSRNKSALFCGAMLLVFGLPIVLLVGNGYLDEYDTWVGTILLVLFALSEAIIFGWYLGLENMREELTRGSQFKIPEIVFPIIRYVVPVFLTVIFATWFIGIIEDALTLQKVAAADRVWVWMARASILSVMGAFAVMTLRSEVLLRSIRGANTSPINDDPVEQQIN